MLGFILPLLLSVGCSHQDQQSQQFARPVKVFRIGEDVPRKITSFAGEVRPRWETTLSFRVAGKISDRPVEKSMGSVSLILKSLGSQ